MRVRLRFLLSFVGTILALACAASELPAKNVVVTHEERSRLEKLPEMVFVVRYPKGKQVGDPVSGMVADITFEGDPKKIIQRLSGPAQTPLFKFAEKHQLAVVSWTTTTVYSIAESFKWSEEQARARDNKMEVAAREWEDGMYDLCKKYKLPKDGYLMYGLSRGAQWAHRIALRYPEYFLAVHAHVNSSYETPVENANICLWLITTGELEWGFPAAKQFYRMAQKLNYPIVFKAQPNLGHQGSREISELGVAFFEYALELRKRYADLKQAVADDPFKSHVRFPKLGFPEELLKGFVDPPFYGDLINEDVVKAEEKNRIPEDLRVGLPSKNVAKAYGYFSE
ncbi:MAG: hypothetical protein AAF558_07710 [Verrucomicrobiota bacterium]